VSDELRDYDTLWQMVFHMFCGNKINLIFQIGDFQGLVGFMNIIPQWKCSVMLKLWDKEIWKKSHVRDGAKLTDRIFNKFELIRMEGNSPDPRIVKIAQMFGFKEEGIRYKDFKWDGEVFDVTMLSKIRED
jgi:RimJ/RimL family protein N-acetyltransferase